MLRLFVFAVLVTFVTPFATFKSLEDTITPPAFDIRQTFVSTPPRQLSGRAVLSILKRQNTCGPGVCDGQDTCCGSSGCCPQGASCCSNGSCCEAGTLCTRNSQGSVGCCPVGQRCSGIEAGDGEVVSSAAPSVTSTRSSTLPSSSTPPRPISTNELEIDQDTAEDTDTSAGAQDQAKPTDDPPPTTSTPRAEVGAGTIIGAVVGGILGWLALCTLFLWWRKRHIRKTAARSRAGAPASMLQVSRGPSNGQGADPELAGLGPVPRGPRPYTTLIDREALKNRVGVVVDPLPQKP